MEADAPEQRRGEDCPQWVRQWVLRSAPPVGWPAGFCH
jgi:hypothetical protein